MRRGDIVIVPAPGDYGKPRRAILIQGDVLNQADPDSMILALMTGTLRDASLLRLTIEPSPQNGLQKLSQIMVDKLQTVRREKIARIIGRLSDKELLELNRLLAMVVGLA
jgi:mRNA interferase MazF